VPASVLASVIVAGKGKGTGKFGGSAVWS